MSMPKDLILVRHGQSEGNVATEAAKNGDESRYTEAFMTTPGSQWRLTDTGRAQAQAIGAWLRQDAFPGIYWGPTRFQAARFHAHFVSPYVRARETAGHLGLPEADWRLNRALRERDWGDIGAIPRSQFESSTWWAENAKTKRADPLYWCAPNGESVAHIAENRVRNFLDTLHREHPHQRVLAVLHAETMQAFRLVLERMSDEGYAAMDRDPAQRIANCEALHYTRIDPFTGIDDRRSERQRTAPRLTWVRRARPVLQDGAWLVETLPWTRIEFASYSNAELLAGARAVPRLYPPDDQGKLNDDDDRLGSAFMGIRCDGPDCDEDLRGDFRVDTRPEALAAIYRYAAERGWSVDERRNLAFCRRHIACAEQALPS